MTQAEKDGQIAELVRSYSAARREQQHLQIRHESHIKALSEVMAAAKVSPRRFDVEGEHLLNMTGPITWPAWEEVRDTLVELKRATERADDLKQQLTTLGIPLT